MCRPVYTHISCIERVRFASTHLVFMSAAMAMNAQQPALARLREARIRVCQHKLRMLQFSIMDLQNRLTIMEVDIARAADDAYRLREIEFNVRRLMDHVGLPWVNLDAIIDIDAVAAGTDDT